MISDENRKLIGTIRNMRVGEEMWWGGCSIKRNPKYYLINREHQRYTPIAVVAKLLSLARIERPMEEVPLIKEAE